MEIERGVKLEYGGDLEGGLSSGPRNMERLPAYTDAEIDEGLGEVGDEIASVFKQSPKTDSEDFVGSGIA